MYGIDVYEGIGRVDWAAVKRSAKHLPLSEQQKASR